MPGTPNEDYKPSSTNFQGSIGNYTTKFDACGAYDDGEAIPHPSKYEKWRNCIQFLEWYGIPMMPGFGIVIINDVSGSSYENLYSALEPKITYESSLDIPSPECYNSAR